MVSQKRVVLFCIIGLMSILTFSGCSKAESLKDNQTEQITEMNLEDRDKDISSQLFYESSMELEYAKCFAVDYYQNDYTLITVADGGRYLGVPEKHEVPQDLEEGVVVLQQPYENIYLVASAVMDMFRELDALGSIRFSGQKMDGWYIEEARTAMEKGDILYAGKYNAPDYELILSEGSSFAIQSTMIYHSPEVIEKLEGFSIPVFVDYSSYENHPLGRVEWIKLYGVLTGKQEEAEKAFLQQTEILKRVTGEEKSGKTVAFFYITVNGSVNVRKSFDYIPKMIELAGGDYIFADLGEEEDKKASVNLQMEEFYHTAIDADYLIYNSATGGEITTVEELTAKSGMLEDFKAVREGNVWCTTSELYQQTMSIGAFMEDIHKLLLGTSKSQEDMKFIYRLSEGGK